VASADHVDASAQRDPDAWWELDPLARRAWRHRAFGGRGRGGHGRGAEHDERCQDRSKGHLLLDGGYRSGRSPWWRVPSTDERRPLPLASMPFPRRLLPVALAAALLSAACDQLPPGSGGNGSEPGQGGGGPGQGGPGEGGPVRRGPLPVRDGEVMFDVFSFVCGETLGSMERTLQPEGYFCDVGISALNRGTAPVRLDPSEQRLLVDGEPRGPWDEAMQELVLSEHDNLFVQAIPPGGGGTASLIFELPDGSTPERLELHASPASAGAVVPLTGCSLWKVTTPGPCALDRRGNVRGTAYPPEAAVGVSYPVSFRIEEGVGLCFEGRDWRVQPTTEDLSGLDGHGVITLVSPELAEYRDNSGVVVRLAPREMEDGEAAVCG
jgi:hypothetical protein